MRRGRNAAQEFVRQCMAETIIDLDERFGEDEDGNLLVQLSRDDLASLVGTATESAIRILSQLNKEGYVELTGKKIKIGDKQKLERMAKGFV